MKRILGLIVMSISALVLSSCEIGGEQDILNQKLLHTNVAKYASHATRTLSTSNIYGDGSIDATGTSNMSFTLLGAGTEVPIENVEGGTEVEGFAEVLRVDVEYDLEAESYITMLMNAYKEANIQIDSSIAYNEFPEYGINVEVDGVTYDKLSRMTYCGPALDENGEYWKFDYTDTRYTMIADYGICSDESPVKNFIYKLEKGSAVDYYRYVNRDAYELNYDENHSGTVQNDVLVAHKHDSNGNGLEDATDFEVVTRAKLVPFNNGIGYELENTMNIRKDFNGDGNLTNKEIANDITYDVNLLTEDTEDYAYHYEYRIYRNGQDNTVFRYQLNEGETVTSKIFDWEIATDGMSSNVAIGLTINYGYFPNGIAQGDTLDNEIGIYYNGDNTEGNPGYDTVASNALVFKMADSAGNAIAPVIKLSAKDAVEENFNSFLDNIANN